MTLSLDHQQRLYLHALMGAQRVPLGDLRVLWKLQDRIDLSDEEREAIGFKIDSINGTEVPGWDRTKTLEPREYEFSEPEAMRVRKIIEEWPGFFAGGDRRWLQSVLAQLPENSQNGHQ